MSGAQIAVVINGASRAIPENSTVADLLSLLSLTQQRIAVELNGVILSRAQFSNQLLQPGDRLELIQAIGGG